MNLTNLNAMRLNGCTIEIAGYPVTTLSVAFLLPELWASCDQFLRIGALMTYRYKAGNSTNKVGRAISVVESTRHLSLYGARYSFLTME
jgi:hypothetical protein